MEGNQKNGFLMALLSLRDDESHDAPVWQQRRDGWKHVWALWEEGTAGKK